MRFLQGTIDSIFADDKLSYTEVPLQPTSGFNFPKPPEQGILSLLNDVKTIVNNASQEMKKQNFSGSISEFLTKQYS